MVKNQMIFYKKKASPFLLKEEEQYVQQVVGSFLLYTHAIDMTILFALSAIASDQANPTQTTLKESANYSTTWRHIQKQSFHTTLLT